MIGLPRDLPAHATQPARNLLIFLDLNSGISLALEPLRGRLRAGVANSTAQSSRAPVRSGALGAPRPTVATRGSRPLGCRNSSARPGHRVSRWQERALRAGEAAQGGNVRMKNERLRPGLGMRLSSKIFLSSALVIVVLAGVSALSLGAVGRLVSVNREITTRTIPALSLTASAREAIPPLLGLEARAGAAVLIALGAAVGLALLGTAIIARRMTRSLDLLSSATAEVAASAFREPIAVDSRDEIGALARSFNSMGSQLRQMEETKREFFATVSHELRSPLTSIRGAVDLLHERAPGPLTEKQERLTGIIAQSSERLLRLANQILEMSRLRAGLVELERKPLDLARLVDRVVEELHPQAEESGVALERERYGSHFAYLGDEERLYQLVVKLGANAIRFTPRRGRVVVRVIDTSSEFELQVEDTGVGIPADALPSIFDPYRQAHRDRGGTGLGLAIVRGIASAHGGRVIAESREGKGSRFTVLLPRS